MRSEAESSAFSSACTLYLLPSLKGAHEYLRTRVALPVNVVPCSPRPHMLAERALDEGRVSVQFSTLVPQTTCGPDRSSHDIAPDTSAGHPCESLDAPSKTSDQEAEHSISLSHDMCGHWGCILWLTL